METLLAVLLYIGAICSPCTYFEHEIDTIENENQDTITTIYDNEDYLDQIIMDYGDAASEVVIEKEWETLGSD